MNADTITKIAYTSRQLNTLPEAPLALFNICFICTLSSNADWSDKDALTPCYDHVEVAYWHNKKIKVVGKISNTYINIKTCTYFSIVYTYRKNNIIISYPICRRTTWNG